MKIAVIGAGAIGGLVGARLAMAGEDVTFMVRGANLEAIRAQRHQADRAATAPSTSLRNVRRPTTTREAGPQDVVVLAVKAHQVDAVAPTTAALFGPETVVVTMQNGIPFWYFHRHGGALEGRQVRQRRSDRRARARSIPAGAIIGCVVYPASELVAPGVIRHIEGDRLPLGELDGSAQRARAARRRRPSSAPASRRRCSTTSAPRSGSSSGAT